MPKRSNAADQARRLLHLISLSDIAIAWSVSRQTARRTLDRFGVAPFVLSASRNGTIRYPEDEIEKLMQRMRRPKSSRP